LPEKSNEISISQEQISTAEVNSNQQSDNSDNFSKLKNCWLQLLDIQQITLLSTDKHHCAWNKPM